MGNGDLVVIPISGLLGDVCKPESSSLPFGMITIVVVIILALAASLLVVWLHLRYRRKRAAMRDKFMQAVHGGSNHSSFGTRTPLKGWSSGRGLAKLGSSSSSSGFPLAPKELTDKSRRLRLNAMSCPEQEWD